MAYFITQDCIGCGLCRRICPSGAIEGQKEKVHVVSDEICIDCAACGRICPSGAVEDGFGIPAVPVKKKRWPKPRFDEKICMSCGICVEACPAGVIAVDLKRKADPRPYPYLANEKGCLGCGFCTLECPVEAIDMVTPDLTKT